MLNLSSATSAEWVALAVENIDTILLDHAHCEKKAASTALTLIFRYPEFNQFLRPLSAVAREELEHFELVLGHLERRGGRFRRLAPSPYAGKLLKVMRESEPDRMIDMLLCCAVIEARSCERMSLLSKALRDPELVDLYSGLLASEARHHMLYVDLACSVVDRGEVKKRLKSISLRESEILSEAPAVPRMHN